MKRGLIIIAFILAFSSMAFAATVSHPASQVSAGQFGIGDFSFNGKVGIGVSPAAAIHTSTPADGTTEALRIAQTGSVVGYRFIIDGSGRLQMYANNGGSNLQVMSFDRTTQNVGIGTATPGAKLEVNGNIIASDPTANNHVATKGYVDANGGGGLSGSSYGADMMNSYYDQLNLFKPHSSATCNPTTEAFIPVYSTLVSGVTSTATVGFCIDKNEWNSGTVKNWEDAKMICASLGKRLPEPWEWKTACQDAASYGLSSMIGNNEWASNFGILLYYGSYGIMVPMLGYNSCSYASFDIVAVQTAAEGSQVFRCVH